MTKREFFLIECMKLIGIPYLWGGKDPRIGLDCSGLGFQLLKLLTLNPPLTNAQGYYNLLHEDAMDVLPGGYELADVLFFGQKGALHHMALALGDQNKSMIESAHGDPSVTNPSIALIRNAKVMVNPISRMPDFYAALRIPGLWN